METHIFKVRKSVKDFRNMLSPLNDFKEEYSLEKFSVDAYIRSDEHLNSTDINFKYMLHGEIMADIIIESIPDNSPLWIRINRGNMCLPFQNLYYIKKLKVFSHINIPSIYFIFSLMRIILNIHEPPVLLDILVVEKTAMDEESRQLFGNDDNSQFSFHGTEYAGFQEDGTFAWCPNEEDY